MIHMIFGEIAQAYRQWRKGRDVMRNLAIPAACGRYSADRMGQPGKRRAARWARM